MKNSLARLIAMKNFPSANAFRNRVGLSPNLASQSAAFGKFQRKFFSYRKRKEVAVRGVLEIPKKTRLPSRSSTRFANEKLLPKYRVCLPKAKRDSVSPLANEPRCARSWVWASSLFARRQAGFERLRKRRPSDVFGVFSSADQGKTRDVAAFSEAREK